MKRLEIADLFCGAGGTSSGAVEAAAACGYAPALTAVNHWQVAVDTHEANHPGARHLCTGIDDINPRDLWKPGGLDVLWASPECTHHSNARGGKPINEQSRATAWCVIRWADALLPPVILVENVPEFVTWGPVDSKQRPIASRKGEIFRAWKANLVALGYRVEHRLLCAADYGDPTTRRRLFVQAVRGRRRIVWPNPTHASAEKIAGGSTLKPWVAAREVIDWSVSGQSIYERKRPLSPKTLRRIEEGLRKFGLGPFIVPNFGEHEQQSPRTHSVSDPLPTVTGSGAGNLVRPFVVAWDNQSGSGIWSAEVPLSTITTKARHGVAEPFLVELRGTSERQLANTARSIDEPVPTVTAGGGHVGVVAPFLVQVAHGDKGNAKTDARRSRALDEPLPTVCGNRGEWALCDPALLPQQSGGALRPVSEPVPTVAAAGAIGLVEPFLVSYYGTGGARSVGAPLDTVTTRDRFGLVRPVVEIQGQRYLLDIRFRMLNAGELAKAQGFPAHYRFTGTKSEQVKQIGNAVPRRLARALVCAALTQNADVSWLTTV